jgi:hypothetical protein
LNESFRDANGQPRPVQFAMVARGSDEFPLGNGADTITVTAPSDVWMPGDVLYALEDTDGDGTPEVTIANFQLACFAAGATYESCNPVALQTPGATGYITTEPGTQEQFLINPLLDASQKFELAVTPQRTATDLAAACAAKTGDACASIQSAVRNVHVVPNPYVVFNNYTNPLNQTDLTKPLFFTNVPPRGTLRIYNVSGQFVQQITWTEADLNETGDLLWDLRSREGNLIAGGLYLFMLTGKDANNKEVGKKMGKFVVIR